MEIEEVYEFTFEDNEEEIEQENEAQNEEANDEEDIYSFNDFEDEDPELEPKIKKIEPIECDICCKNVSHIIVDRNLGDKLCPTCTSRCCVKCFRLYTAETNTYKCLICRKNYHVKYE